MVFSYACNKLSAWRKYSDQTHPASQKVTVLLPLPANLRRPSKKWKYTDSHSYVACKSDLIFKYWFKMTHMWQQHFQDTHMSIVWRQASYLSLLFTKMTQCNIQMDSPVCYPLHSRSVFLITPDQGSFRPDLIGWAIFRESHTQEVLNIHTGKQRGKRCLVVHVAKHTLPCFTLHCTWANPITSCYPAQQTALHHEDCYGISHPALLYFIPLSDSFMNGINKLSRPVSCLHFSSQWSKLPAGICEGYPIKSFSVVFHQL